MTVENKTDSVSYIVFETEMARAERREKRRSIIDAVIILTLIVALVGSWLFFWHYESQFEDVIITQEVEQDAENGSNHFIGGDHYGATESKNNG